MDVKRRVFFGVGLWLAVAAALPTVARDGSGAELFVNEDCWHFWVADSGEAECMKRDGFSPLKPGMGATEEGLKAYIDEIARGKVTHFLMNVNGQRANFPSKVLEPVWTSLSEPDRAHEKWVETLKRLADEGRDPYAVWIARCREKGVSPWISVRMNDLHRVGRADCPNVCTMWREHPEFLLKTGATWGGGFDYSQPQIRERMLSFIREVLDRYDADGLELDLLRFPRYLPEGREKELAPLLTDYIREIRCAVEEASAKRGRRIVLSVRVKAVPKENLDRGMDVGEWARQGLVDMVVPCNMWANIRFDIPLGEWREWTGGRVKIVPGADSGITEEGKKRRSATLAEYRRWALEMRKRGAGKSFYLYNLFLHPQDGEVWNGILSEGLIPASGAVDHYVVSPMSETPYLPGDVPADGTKGGIVRIVAAKGEYEPGSFVLRAPKDLGSVEVSVGKFENGNGDVFPSEDLDLTVVKVWYQNRNGWYSYFGDCGWKLVPELLLHDEDLIEVDEANERNYARIVREDGSVFRKWLNPPRQVDVGFQSMRKGFSDAPALCRVRLEKNRSKQFFLTAHVRPGTPAGDYRGEIKGKSKGEKGKSAEFSIPVVLRVLDFELPQYPCTYADPYREIFVSSYDTTGFRTIAELNGGDLELAKRQFVAICRNYVAHGQSLIKNPARTADETLATFDVMREAGMRQDVFNGAVRVLRFKDPENHVEEMRAHAKKLAKMLDDEIGHHNVFIAYGDEPGVAWLVRNRPVFDTYRAEGFKFFIAGGDAVFNKCGWCYDWHNVAKSPEDDSSARLWAQLPTHPSVAWYAFQHTGPENPAFNRRQYGLAAYLSGYTAICNLGHGAGLTSYNDDTVTYRPFLMNHRSYDGVLDTLQWEGFREGIDDMRYATLLVRLARKVAALGTSDAKVAANKAAMTLARADRTRDDLGCLRGEIIRQIGLLARFADPGSVLEPVVVPAARPPKAPHDLPTYKFKPKVFTNVNFTNPEPTNVAHMVRKEYVVRFSDRMISGLGDWELLSVRPEVQNLDRKYKGGSLDFMETDVATGDRGKVTAGAKSLRYSTLQVAADAWGIHFRFEAFSDKAREAALGIGGLGSFESYLAPGPDAPHECFMTTVNSHPKPHVWHSQYDHAGYRRSDANDRNSYRQEVRFTDTSAIVYSAFSWEQFFSYLPKDGDVWDFEVVNWGAVKSAWNGLESIHGRSTWGKLRFAMSASDSRLIRRRLVHFAVRDFRNAFSTNGGEGIAARLMDAETGDPEFYAAAVKPLADELEAAAQRASVDMSDETVDELAEKYLARWRDFPYTVQRLRDDYLKEKAK